MDNIHTTHSQHTKSEPSEKNHENSKSDIIKPSGLWTKNQEYADRFGLDPVMLLDETGVVAVIHKSANDLKREIECKTCPHFKIKNEIKSHNNTDYSTYSCSAWCLFNDSYYPFVLRSSEKTPSDCPRLKGTQSKPVIHKIQLKPDQMIQSVEMPINAEILTASDQKNHQVSLWYKTNPDFAEITETRTFCVVPTGAAMPEQAKTYLGTAKLNLGTLILHIFEGK